MVFKKWFLETQPSLIKLEKFQDVIELLKVTRESLYKGIEAAVVGNRIGDIGYAIQNYAESNGFSIVRELVGHGLGETFMKVLKYPITEKEEEALNYKKDWLLL